MRTPPAASLYSHLFSAVHSLLFSDRPAHKIRTTTIFFLRLLNFLLHCFPRQESLSISHCSFHSHRFSLPFLSYSLLKMPPSSSLYFNTSTPFLPPNPAQIVSVSMSSSSGVNHLSQPCVYGQFISSYAERKSGFMKWLIKFFKGGSSRGVRNGRHPQFLGEENMDDRSRAENEEFDHAVALSLAEDLKKPNGYKKHTENDDNLARALQENLNMSSYPPHVPAQFYPRGYRFCGGCNNDIGCGKYLVCLGAFWHPGCFCCYSCGYPITEHEFSLSGRNPYHKPCFKELHHPKCEVCHEFIPTNRAGLIEYRSHPFWCQKYCPSHEHDNTTRCSSCERLEIALLPYSLLFVLKSWNAHYISLGDGRNLCLECMESAIMDTGDCQPLYHAIRDYYEGMNMRLDQQIPMLLVERQALNEAIEGEKNGNHRMPETRGLCLSEEQTVSTIHKKPRIGGNRLIGMGTYPHKLPRKCEITAILVLYGLPRLLTGSILAHELMHGWLRLNGYRNLSPEVEEGICQVLSHMWLESEVVPESTNMPSTSTASASSSSSSSKKGGKSDIEKKLGEFFIYQISHDTSSAYGEGFRAANAAVNRYGLRSTLNHIYLTGNLPL
ncbi:hypothetical protein HHK36_016300 [Tetracentron sinense]|uniref:LIM zinc-binding domain-containing protein n=1 Tax=Tetracentron sinense TaxID=13715 RepID=A0A834Z5J1_TETSI|nr:hypothetical protein HHK36_016300 [Tetracentron sinense]